MVFDGHIVNWGHHLTADVSARSWGALSIIARQW